MPTRQGEAGTAGPPNGGEKRRLLLCLAAVSGYARVMDGDPSDMAFARIEAALARIEAAARNPRASGGGDELARLQQRHDRLRAAVQDSLIQLDQLIEGAQG